MQFRRSTRQSLGTPIYYVDLTVRSGMTVEDTLADAKQREAERQRIGFDQVALDAAARHGLENGAFEESDEDGTVVVEEFFQAGEDSLTTPETQKQARPGLLEKLDAKATLVSA